MECQTSSYVAYDFENDTDSLCREIAEVAKQAKIQAFVSSVRLGFIINLKDSTHLTLTIKIPSDLTPDKYESCKRPVCCNLERLLALHPEATFYIDPESQILFKEFCKAFHRNARGHEVVNTLHFCIENALEAITCINFVENLNNGYTESEKMRTTELLHVIKKNSQLMNFICNLIGEQRRNTKHTTRDNTEEDCDREEIFLNSKILSWFQEYYMIITKLQKRLYLKENLQMHLYYTKLTRGTLKGIEGSLVLRYFVHNNTSFRCFLINISLRAYYYLNDFITDLPPHKNAQIEKMFQEADGDAFNILEQLGFGVLLFQTPTLDYKTFRTYEQFITYDWWKVGDGECELTENMIKALAMDIVDIDFFDCITASCNMFKIKTGKSRMKYTNFFNYNDFNIF